MQTVGARRWLIAGIHSRWFTRLGSVDIPDLDLVEHSGSAHLPDDFRDSGFSILPVTPHRLPDLHLAIGVLLTVFNRNKANDGKATKETSMAHHVD